MIILVALAGSVAGLIALALWTQQPDMQVLFTNLNGEDAAAIIDKLKESKTPYDTTGGGSTSPMRWRIRSCRRSRYFDGRAGL